MPFFAKATPCFLINFNHLLKDTFCRLLSQSRKPHIFSPSTWFTSIRWKCPLGRIFRRHPSMEVHSLQSLLLLHKRNSREMVLIPISCDFTLDAILGTTLVRIAVVTNTNAHRWCTLPSLTSDLSETEAIFCVPGI